MSSIFIFSHFTGKIEGKIEDGEIRGLKQMDTSGTQRGFFESAHDCLSSAQLLGPVEFII